MACAALPQRSRSSTPPDATCAALLLMAHPHALCGAHACAGLCVFCARPATGVDRLLDQRPAYGDGPCGAACGVRGHPVNACLCTLVGQLLAPSAPWLVTVMATPSLRSLPLSQACNCGRCRQGLARWMARAVDVVAHATALHLENRYEDLPSSYTGPHAVGRWGCGARCCEAQRLALLLLVGGCCLCPSAIARPSDAAALGAEGMLLSCP